MLVKDFCKLIKQGFVPTIRFKKEFEHYASEITADVNMVCKVINTVPAPFGYNDGDIRFEFDFNEFEMCNRMVAKLKWRDKNGNLALTWMDTLYYPEDGIDVMYLPEDAEIPFEVIDKNS